MYHGYTEPEEKIEARKQRILGTVTSIENSPVEDQKRTKPQKPTDWTKRKVLMIVLAYPAAFIIGDLLGRLLETILRR
jgi:hypothetical protein